MFDGRREVGGVEKGQEKIIWSITHIQQQTCRHDSISSREHRYADLQRPTRV